MPQLGQTRLAGRDGVEEGPLLGIDGFRLSSACQEPARVRRGLSLSATPGALCGVARRMGDLPSLVCGSLLRRHLRDPLLLLAGSLLKVRRFPVGSIDGIVCRSIGPARAMPSCGLRRRATMEPTPAVRHRQILAGFAGRPTGGPACRREVPAPVKIFDDLAGSSLRLCRRPTIRSVFLPAGAHEPSFLKRLS
ncbi:hypothetical protein [Aureimonas pseudogalii]